MILKSYIMIQNEELWLNLTELISSLFSCTVNYQFKKYIKMQINLHKTFFLEQPVFRFTIQIFLKSNSRFKKGKIDFLKSRVYCTIGMTKSEAK